MCKRKKDPYQGKYNFVGGKIKPGEDHLQAAYRELQEETNITNKDVTLTHFMDFTYYLDDTLLETYVATLFKDVNIHIASDNCLVIDAPMICEKSLHTNDLAELADDGRRFRILGRKDNIIDSGGIKISMEAIENLLRPHIKTQFIITKRHDPRLGEAVTMLIEKEGANINTIRNVCERVLPKYWHPQSYFTVTQIPTTETGKPARAEAIKLAHLAYTSKSENTK